MSLRTSIQLYTVREALEENLEQTVAELFSRGFSAVEPYDFVRRAPQLAAALAAHGMSAPTGHAFLASTSISSPDGSTVTVSTPEAVCEAAVTLGMNTVFEPFVPPERWETREQIEETARLLNAACEVGESFGIRVGYHNHAHELEAVIDGTTGLELLAQLLDPRVVLEIDLYWVARAGLDPVGLLERLGERVTAMHVKDGTLDAALTAANPPLDQVVAGQGAVPLAESLAAATSVEYAIVEFDHFDGDLFDAVEQSRLFLEARSAE